MPSSEIRIANAPCSWGVLEFSAHAPTYGSADVLDEIASTGYQGTELGDWGFMPTDPAALRDELKRRALTLVGGFVPVALADAGAHAAGVATAVRTASLMRDAGHADAFIVLADDTDGNNRRTAVAGRVTLGDGLSPDQWDVAAQGAAAVARAVGEQTGLRTVIHPHCGSFVETEAEIDALLGRIDPELLGLCLDTGHVMYGGGDPLSVYARHATRVWHVHLKDCEPRVAAEAAQERLNYFEAVRRGVFCELGRGGVDFRAFVAALQRERYRGWAVVEQDVLPSLGTPAASAERNRAYLRSLGL
ncbi:MAG: TIM barrel protein [Acidobacteria bacterium]|nr:TIM barrel protein [Acidobacteriota bacterium]